MANTIKQVPLIVCRHLMVRMMTTITSKYNKIENRWKLISYNPNYSPFDASGINVYECIKCGYITDTTTNYCPQCGDKKIFFSNDNN